MLQKFATNYEQWLLPRSRYLLAGLVVANACLALVLTIQPEESVIVSPTPAALGPEIQLLAEIPAAEFHLQAAPRECRLWGPESDPQAFMALVAQLDAMGSFPEVQKREISGAPDYLVYVGELGSRDNAKRVARELNALEIDNYLINREAASPIISVGVFSRKSLADQHIEKIAGLGYHVFLEQLERAQTVYSLVAHVSADTALYNSSTSACMAFAHNL